MAIIQNNAKGMFVQHLPHYTSIPLWEIKENIEKKKTNNDKRKEIAFIQKKQKKYLTPLFCFAVFFLLKTILVPPLRNHGLILY